MKIRRIVTAALICLALISTQTALYAEPRALIELFTSQNCSSCPPADALLGEFARDSSLVVMSLSVDYWDYLGWKDTLALKGHTKRQQAYARVRGDRAVYTPQAVINGLRHALGSDRAAIERAIVESHRDGSPLILPLRLLVDGDQLTVQVPVGKEPQGPVEVWLCPISKTVSVAIERGENRGRTVTYSNVVRRWIKLGDWSGKAETYRIAIKDFQSGDIDAVAAIVQSGGASAPALVLGAAITALR